MPEEMPASDYQSRDEAGGLTSGLPDDPSLRPTETVDALEEKAREESGDLTESDEEQISGEDVVAPTDRLGDEFEGESGTEASEPPG